MKATPGIIRPHQRQPRRSQPPRALMSFWLALAAITLGCAVGYAIGEHRGFLKGQAGTEIIVK